NTLAQKWAGALNHLGSDSTAVLNADDPLVAALGLDLQCEVRYFGVDGGMGSLELEHAADSLFCPRCGGLLRFEAVNYGHLGHYRCPQCGFERPGPGFLARDVELGLDEPTRFRVGDLVLETGLPGLYNVYNALAAIA